MKNFPKLFDHPLFSEIKFLNDNVKSEMFTNVDRRIPLLMKSIENSNNGYLKIEDESENFVRLLRRCQKRMIEMGIAVFTDTHVYTLESFDANKNLSDAHWIQRHANADAKRALHDAKQKDEQMGEYALNALLMEAERAQINN